MIALSIFQTEPALEDNVDLDEIVKVTDRSNEVIALGRPQEEVKQYEYAEWVDLKQSVADFHKRIPDMAYKVTINSVTAYNYTSG